MSQINTIKKRSSSFIGVTLFVLLSLWMTVRMVSCIGPDEVSMNRSEAMGENGLVTFRMNEPFTLAITHRVQKNDKVPQQGSYANFERVEPSYEKLVARFPSRYDWLRGGHISTVHLTIDNSQAVLKSSGDTVFVEPFNLSPSAVQTIHWTDRSATLGKHIVIPLGDFETAPEFEERLWVYPQPNSTDDPYPPSDRLTDEDQPLLPDGEPTPSPNPHP